MAVSLEFQNVYNVSRSASQNWYYLFGSSILLFLALSLKVALKVQLTDIGYKIATEEQLAIDYDSERRDLELQLSILSRPDTLMKQAKTRLSLENFNPERVRQIY